jgi:hypothetical protein
MKLTIENIINIIKTSKSVSAIIRSLNKNIILKDFIIYKTSFLNDDANLKQRLYHIKNELYSVQKCDMCHINDKEWNDKHSTYKPFCSNKDCKMKHVEEVCNRDIINDKIHKTKIERYGEDYGKKLYFKNKETCIRKYGVDHYTKTDEYKKLMMDKFGYISPFELKETHEKSKKTLMDKYGVDHNFKIPGMTQKIKDTFTLKYGYDRPLKCPHIKNKMIQKNIIKFGFSCPLKNEKIFQKSKDKLMKNYGVLTPLSSSVIFEKFKNTNLKKYGETHWMKNADFYNNFLNIKKKTTYKIYNLNDEEIKLQGYEDYVFDELLKCYNRTDILIGQNLNKYIGQIKYDFNEIEHTYYPDFFIKSENLIIEVKSPYTYMVDLERNIEKEKSCINLGFNFQFIIINKKDYNMWKRKKIKLNETNSKEN